MTPHLANSHTRPFRFRSCSIRRAFPRARRAKLRGTMRGDQHTEQLNLRGRCSLSAVVLRLGARALTGCGQLDAHEGSSSAASIGPVAKKESLKSNRSCQAVEGNARDTTPAASGAKVEAAAYARNRPNHCRPCRNRVRIRDIAACSSGNGSRGHVRRGTGLATCSTAGIPRKSHTQTREPEQLTKSAPLAFAP